MPIHRAERPDGWCALVEHESERERGAVRAPVHGARVVTPAAARSANPVVGASMHAQPRAVDDALGLTRREDEGGPVDLRPTGVPVNAFVRELVRACLIPHASPA